MGVIRIEPASPSDRDLVRRLLEFNAYEFSRFDGADVDARGEFGYEWLDAYWSDEDRHPFLITVDDAIAGLALVRSRDRSSIAEFLVMPKYRRSGVGTAAARAIFALFPGVWEVHQVPGNRAATEFWHAAIAVEFTETTDDDGTTQWFTTSF